jgi:hypothetical protein
LRTPSHPSFPNLLRHSASLHFSRVPSRTSFTTQETPSSKVIRFRTKYSHFIFGTVMLLNRAALRHSEPTRTPPRDSRAGHIVTNIHIRNYDVARTMQISGKRSPELVTQSPRVSYLEEPQFCFPRSSTMPDREDADVKSGRQTGGNFLNPPAAWVHQSRTLHTRSSAQLKPQMGREVSSPSWPIPQSVRVDVPLSAVRMGR